MAVARYMISAGQTPTEPCGLIIDRDDEGGAWLRWENLTPRQQEFLSAEEAPAEEAPAEEAPAEEARAEESTDGGAGTEVQ